MSISAANLAKAEAYKAEGNALVGKGDFRGAASKYVRVFAYAGMGNPMPPMAQLMGATQPPSSKQQAAELADTKAEEATRQDRIAVLVKATNLNLSLCFLKLGEAEKAVKYASRVLEKEQGHAKALLRRGSAYLELRDVENAGRDFDRAEAAMSEAEAAGSAALLKHARAKLKQLKKKQLKKQQKKFAGFFDRLKQADQKKDKVEEEVVGTQEEEEEEEEDDA